MGDSQFLFLWGVVAVACGAFMLTYGAFLFKYVLAFAGFYLGFTVGMILPVPMSQLLHMLVALVLGGIVGFLLYRMVQITLYAAGALLGLVLGLLVGALAGQASGTIAYVLGLAGAVVGGIFGRSLGDWALILASAAAGAYATVVGINLMLTDAATMAEIQSTGLMPRSWAAIVVFIIFGIVSILAQMQIRDLRRRVLNRRVL